MTNPVKILIVDDEPLITELVQMVLAEEGYQVDVANTVTQALAKVEVAAYQLVITDFTLPGMTGDKLALAMRQKGYAGPILLVSGYPFFKLPAEVCRVLPKPINFTELRLAVEELLYQPESEARPKSRCVG